DPPADERHGLRLASRVRRGVGRGAPVSVRLRERGLRGVNSDVVVVGAGQAGLATSHELTQAGVDHVVLERGRVGETWRGRWDSFCLVIPNWTVQLPGGHYRGDDPDGFMPKNEIVSHLMTYAESFRAPVRDGVTVTSLEAAENASFLLRTSSGQIRA